MRRGTYGVPPRTGLASGQLGSDQPTRRNRRIRDLRAAGWSLAAIGADVSLSAERVRQILASTDEAVSHAERDERLARREHDLLASIDRWNRHRELVDRHLRALRRELRVVEEERQSARIDRMLGLA